MQRNYRNNNPKWWGVQHLAWRGCHMCIGVLAMKNVGARRRPGSSLMHNYQIFSLLSKSSPKSTCISVAFTKRWLLLGQRRFPGAQEGGKKLDLSLFFVNKSSSGYLLIDLVQRNVWQKNSKTCYFVEAEASLRFENIVQGAKDHQWKASGSYSCAPDTLSRREHSLLQN